MTGVCSNQSFLRIAVPLVAGAMVMYFSMNFSSVWFMKFEYNAGDNPQRTHPKLEDIQGMITKSNGKPPIRHDNTQEVRHIAFLKVHKCASSTMLNTMYRFGMKRDLTYVLPVYSNYIKFEKNSITELPPHLHSDYDMLCNHVSHFDKSRFAHYLPPDTVYLAIVREPFQRMQSAFNYYRDVFQYATLLSIKGDNAFETYLKDPEHYESKWTDASVTNNNMARDFGFPYKDFREESKFANYLKDIDKTFQLVLVTELYDESLILMRRMLNWPLASILYLAKNVHSSQSVSEVNVTSKVNQFLALDRMLYDHFVSKLKTMIETGGTSFQDEVEYFRELNKRTNNFCMTNNTMTIMPVQASIWNEEFTLTQSDCVLMKTHEMALLQLIRRKHISKIDRFGANMTKLLHR